MSYLYHNDLSMIAKLGKIAGVDEAGRGPLAGPVVVAAVILDYENPVPGVNDSKKLNSNKREELFEQITQRALKYSIIEISASEIDKYNILQATLIGMEKAIKELSELEVTCLIDGNHLPHSVSQNCLPVIKGDSKHACIAAASILAKVHRDRIMCALHEKYPVYGFDKHKGYPTKHHLYAISSFGICPEHRVSYAPIKQISIWELTGS